MHPSQQEINSEIGEEYADKGEDAVCVEETRPVKPFEAPRVQGKCVNEQGNQRPGLLGVPRPIIAPGYVRPDCPDKGAEGKQEYRRVKNDEADVAEPLFRVFLSGDKPCDAENGDKGKCRVRKYHAQHMNPEQGRAKYGHKRLEYPFAANQGEASQQ